MSQRRPQIFNSHPVSFNQARAWGRSRAYCEYVSDADTYDVWVDAGWSHYPWFTGRLKDFDAPETHRGPGITDAEIQHGLAARTYVRETITRKPLLIRTYILPSADKEDITLMRYVFDVWVWFYDVVDGWGWVLLADILRAAGFEKRTELPGGPVLTRGTLRKAARLEQDYGPQGSAHREPGFSRVYLDSDGLANIMTDKGFKLNQPLLGEPTDGSLQMLHIQRYSIWSGRGWRRKLYGYVRVPVRGSFLKAKQRALTAGRVLWPEANRVEMEF